MNKSPYPLFSVLGLEIEYMLVDQETLDVRPLADVLLRHEGEGTIGERSLGDIAISNELVMHLIELKNNDPQPLTAPFTQQFQSALETLSPLLAQKNLMLLPTGAHPWMDPAKETVRWPYSNKAIYDQYDRIFNCEGHGWSNVQSMHINLPFANEEEFFRLHSAMRLILPLIPALAASSPFIEGRKTGFLDTRLDFYGRNQQKIPAITGEVIPEFIHSPKDYQTLILEPMYAAIRPYDKEGILQEEWLNSRGAIPKFAVNAIEIRLVDTQECVLADIAIAKAVSHILKEWIEASDYFLKNPCAQRLLTSIYKRTLTQGFDLEVDNREFCRQLQVNEKKRNCRDIWTTLIEKVSTSLDRPSQVALERILSHGNLSQRLLKTHQTVCKRSSLKSTYQHLAYCLQTNQQYLPRTLACS